MQSPAIFDSSHPQSPYHTIAQMYLNSSGQSRPAQQYDMQGAHQLTHQSNGDGEDRGDQRKWRVPDDMAGILTPGEYFSCL